MFDCDCCWLEVARLANYEGVIELCGTCFAHLKGTQEGVFTRCVWGLMGQAVYMGALARANTHMCFVCITTCATGKIERVGTQRKMRPSREAMCVRHTQHV